MDARYYLAKLLGAWVRVRLLVLARGPGPRNALVETAGDGAGHSEE